LSFIEETACGDQNFKKEIINLFIEKIPVDVANLQKAFSRDDYDAVKRLTHNMKSSLDMFMLTDLSNCLSVIEAEAILERFTEMGEDEINTLASGIVDVVKYLKEVQ